MISCKLQGGLGNQLFQIYTTIAHAGQTNSKFFFLDVYDLKSSTTDRHTYWETFLSGLKPFLLDPELIKIESLVVIKEKNFSYSPLSTTDQNKDRKIQLLQGYFQSPKYFDNYFYSINRILKIRIFIFCVLP